MGNDCSLGSQINVWRHHNLRCSKAGHSELETVISNKDIMPVPVICKYEKDLNKN